MSGKARPSLRKKTLENVRFCNLSDTDKKCIFEVFRRYEEMLDIVFCKECINEQDCPNAQYQGENGHCIYGERKGEGEC